MGYFTGIYRAPTYSVPDIGLSARNLASALKELTTRSCLLGEVALKIVKSYWNCIHSKDNDY